VTAQDGGGPTVTEFAPAKINLYLEILGKRPDGYHLISSLIVFAGIGDEVALAPGKGLSLEIDGPYAPVLADDTRSNLMMRAAQRLANEVAVPADVAMRLTKRLPVASGIGGGSADAAATLRALVRLWRKDPGGAALARLGLALGADLPVCLDGRPSLVSGIGEIVEPAPPLPRAWLALVNPGVAVATREVFAARTGDFSPPLPWTETPSDAARLAARLADRRNDLAAPAIGIAPVIGEALAALESRPGCLLARMSGSGATCFGLFASAEAASAAATSIGAARPDWWSVPAPILP
jgi:4-diphosphocytidyl-2-C-methyl-D-erythritol kinase